MIRTRRNPTLAFAAAESRRTLRQLTGKSHALLTGRGAAAIWATLRALDLRDGTVLIPANTCYLVLWAVLQSGNRPILVDVDPNTGNISPETLDQCSVERADVVIPAHMYGLPARMNAIMEWARERDAFVIEDAALAIGASVDRRPAGGWGDVSIFSFGPGKIADAGLGGALLTDDSELVKEAETLLADMPLWDEGLQRLNQQWLDLYWPLHQFETETPRLLSLYPALFEIYGSITRFRLPDLYTDALVDELMALDVNLKRRDLLASQYDDLLADVPIRTLDRPDESALWHYPLLVPAEHRDRLLRRLWDEDVFEATRWYPSLQAMRSALAPTLPTTPTPNADQLAAEIINLPLSPDMERDAAEMISEIVLRYFDGV